MYSKKFKQRKNDMKGLYLLVGVVLTSILFSACGNKPSSQVSEEKSIEADSTILSPVALDSALLSKSWHENLEMDGMTLDDPQEYLLVDLDSDGVDEVMMRGDGFTAVFEYGTGELRLIAKSFGEFETVSLGKEGYVCYKQESGRREDLGAEYYYFLQDSHVVKTLVHISDLEGDDDDAEAVQTFKKIDAAGSSVDISEEEFKKERPETTGEDASSLAQWIPFSR